MEMIKQVTIAMAAGVLLIRHSVKIKERKEGIRALEIVDELYGKELKVHRSLTELTPLQLIREIISIKRIGTQIEVLSILEEGNVYLFKGNITTILKVSLNIRTKKNVDMNEEIQSLYQILIERTEEEERREKVNSVFEVILLITILVNILFR